MNPCVYCRKPMPPVIGQRRHVCIFCCKKANAKNMHICHDPDHLGERMLPKSDFYVGNSGMPRGECKSCHSSNPRRRTTLGASEASRRASLRGHHDGHGLSPCSPHCEACKREQEEIDRLSRPRVVSAQSPACAPRSAGPSSRRKLAS